MRGKGCGVRGRLLVVMPLFQVLGLVVGVINYDRIFSHTK